MSFDKAKIKSILIVRNDRFGEFLLNIPAIRALKRVYRDAKIAVAVDKPVAELARSINCFDEVIIWSSGKHGFFDKLRFIRELKKKDFDLALILNPSQDFHLFTYFANIPVRIGYDRKCGFCLTHKIRDRKHLGERHEVEYNLELAALAGAEASDKQLFIGVNDDIIKNLQGEFILGQEEFLIAVHPWTSDPIKQWPLESFKELVKNLLSEFGQARIILLGGPESVAKSQQIFGFSKGNFINLTGRTTLLQAAAFLKKCRVLVSGDSGPVHLAASVGTPVVALFRNDLTGKTAKRWGPWGTGHVLIEKNKLTDITVNEVLVKVREVLGK